MEQGSAWTYSVFISRPPTSSKNVGFSHEEGFLHTQSTQSLARYSITHYKSSDRSQDRLAILQRDGNLTHVVRIETWSPAAAWHGFLILKLRMVYPNLQVQGQWGLLYQYQLQRLEGMVGLESVGLDEGVCLAGVQAEGVALILPIPRLQHSLLVHPLKDSKGENTLTWTIQAIIEVYWTMETSRMVLSLSQHAIHTPILLSWIAVRMLV